MVRPYDVAVLAARGLRQKIFVENMAGYWLIRSKDLSL